jgi:hypothetical protein
MEVNDGKQTFTSSTGIGNRSGVQVNLVAGSQKWQISEAGQASWP